ncbi:MAG: 4-hydroxy-tetrahydrodipicolinate synthase [Trichodesmium sp. St4_bin8_1]|nr:4-hydroxy-tetrahydrodipicolinate synthase [Trichodesmium sp. St4_bin8_1]
MVNFGSVLTAMITPFNLDGSVNYEETEKLSIWLTENGTDSLVVCGTTGESPSLTWEEEYELFQVVQKAVGGKAKVIAGTGSNSTKEAIIATEKAAKLGLGGSLQVVPYYNKPPQSGLYRHFQAIAQATPDFPIIIYNIPGRTGKNMEPETVARLAEISNIVAIKEASGNLDQVSQIRNLTAPEFKIYSGDDYLTLPLMAIGGNGVVSVASHLVGNKLQEMIVAFKTGEVQRGTKIHLELFNLSRTLFATTNPIPIKEAMNMLGWNVGKTRLPLCDPPAEIIEKLRVEMDKLDLLPDSFIDKRL